MHNLPIRLILGLIYYHMIHTLMKYSALSEIFLLRYKAVLHTVLPHFSVLNKGEYMHSSVMTMLGLAD